MAEHLERPKLEIVIPMMLQFWKVVFIRGSLVTTGLAAVYWSNWAVVQYCHLWIWLDPWTRELPWLEYGNPIPNWTVRHGDSIDNFAYFSSFVAVVLLLTSDALGSFWLGIVAVDGLGLASEPTMRLKFTVHAFIVVLALVIIILTMGGMILSLSIIVSGERGTDPRLHAWCSFWAVVIVFLNIMVYYMFTYDDLGTYKPAWLDWFG